jgi:hypothetical protein
MIDFNFYLNNLVAITRDLDCLSYEEFRVFYEKHKNLCKIQIHPDWEEANEWCWKEWPHEDEDFIEDAMRGVVHDNVVDIFVDKDKLSPDYVNEKVKDMYDWDGNWDYELIIDICPINAMMFLSDIAEGDNVYMD